MLGNFLFYSGLIVSLTIGFMYFRDLGDVIQMVLKVKRENMVRIIRYEKQFVTAGLAAAAVMVIGYLTGGGTAWIFWISMALVALFYVFPYVWVHLGLRNQQDSAKFYPIKEARDFISPTASVMVIENNGHARAHSDGQLMRPHLAGDEKGLDGEDVVMTYCAMANLGIAYTPAIEGKKLKLKVLAQHGNNLILRDESTGEPIQHIYGFRDSDRDPNAEGAVCAMRPAQAMKPWPTFRMSFRGFQKAFPDGDVFLNKPSSNPLLRVLDMVTEMAFSAGIGRQHQQSAPVIGNMTHFDDRLLNKTYVWGVTVGNDAVCWTDDFVVEQGNVVNATVGGRAVVVAWDPKFESLGVWYNDSGIPVTHCDFWGDSDQGKLERVETLRSGLFWHVWVEFFQETDINRVGTTSATPEDNDVNGTDAAA